MIGLLQLLDEHSGAVEADLQGTYHIDLRDLWRFDEQGFRRLTLRRVWVLVTHLPPAAATRIALGGSGWDRKEHLAADLWHAIVKSPHPGLPVVESPVDPKKSKRVAEFKKRAAERQRQIDAGEIT
ncbi:MAG TPA: hypothetical protein DDY88_03735 [Actinobacteria bacterium]|nr:hypothetical protein [Actinomycetota bacterium]